MNAFFGLLLILFGLMLCFTGVGIPLGIIAMLHGTWTMSKGGEPGK